MLNSKNNKMINEDVYQNDIDVKKAPEASNINEDVISEEPTDKQYTGECEPEMSLEEAYIELRNDRDAWQKKCMYTMADFDTYKRNADKEKKNLAKYGSEKVVKDILPILDDFERSFEHLDPEAAKGVKLVYNKFVNVLTKHGVSAFEVKEGDLFNEEYHEAISVLPAPTEEQKGTIAACNEIGYILNDKVIRYAKVVVFN